MRVLPSVDQIAATLKRAPQDQPWRHEGGMRAWLRQRAILLDGRSWTAADRAARRLIAQARRRNRVREPGPQIGWDQNRLYPWEPHECAICEKWFVPQSPETLYCSSACRWRAGYIRRVSGDRPRPPGRCGLCGTVLIEEQEGVGGRPRRYCSEAHRSLAYQRRKRAEQLADRELAAEEQPRLCAECGGPIAADADPRRLYCGKRCMDRAGKRRRANGAARPNGHAQPNGHDVPAVTVTIPTCIVGPEEDRPRRVVPAGP